MNRSKTLLIILAVTGLARVLIFAVPIVGIYLFNENAIEMEVREK